MTGHGGFSLGKSAAERALRQPNDAASLAAAAPAAAQPGPIKGLHTEMVGFRHFLADVPATVAPNGSNEPPAEKVRKLRQLAKGLATVVKRDFRWMPHSQAILDRYPGVEVWENPGIPSGYTYLLQLMAHDIVSTSFPVSVLDAGMTAARNMRSAPLQLDTIYGGGPADCPLMYASDANGAPRTALRLGAMAADPADVPMGRPLRDIPRVKAPEDNATPGLLTEPLIADARNDNNALISQTTVMFHILHNAILALLPTNDPASADDPAEAAFERFLCARGAVTLIYRRIIRKDLLARILHPAVHALYDVPKPPFLEMKAASPGGDFRIPLEFAAAAFRFGHAMIRPFYRFNNAPGGGEFGLLRVLEQNSAQTPIRMPFSREWIVGWSNFFEIDGSRPNFSRRIGPNFSPDMLNVFFPAVDETTQAGLAYRDFISGGVLNLPSAQVLIAKLRAIRPGLIEKSPFLKGDAYRQDFRAFLTDYQQKGFLPNVAVDKLVDSTPLGFFVLLEAALDPQTHGLRLGLLGSIIVADVIHAAMARNPVFGEGIASLPDALKALCLQTYSQNHLAVVPDIGSMAALIKFAAQGNPKPSFI